VARSRSKRRRVNRKDSKVWHAVFYVAARPGTRRLGRFPKLGVKQARKEAETLRANPPDRRRMQDGGDIPIGRRELPAAACGG
jgi:hypothetical protein